MLVFVSDLDGTLLPDNGRLPASTIDRLNRLIDAGVHFTVASARGGPSIRSIVSGLRLGLPIIEQNGALLSDYASGHLCSVNPIEPGAANALCDTFSSIGVDPILSVIVDGRNVLYYRSLNNAAMGWYIDDKGRHDDPRPVLASELFTAARSGQLLSAVVLASRDEIDEILACVDAGWIGVEKTIYHNPHADAWELCITGADVNKGTALTAFRRLIGEDCVIVAIGDGENDIGLLRSADTAVAVANASDATRAEAHVIIGTNNEQAVASLMERWLEMGSPLAQTALRLTLGGGHRPPVAGS